MVERINVPKVHLFISCRKLKDTDVMSKTDPFVEVYEISQANKQTKIGVTEVVDNNLNPDFVTHFELNYLFEEVQTLRFVVYDSENGRAIASKNNYIGEAVCTLADVQGSPGQQLIRTIKDKNKSNGCIVLRTEQINENNDRIMIQFEGKGLEDHSGIFHSFKPFFTLSRVMENGNSQRVYMSEHIKGKNVIWKNVDISLQDLCNGDVSRPIKFELHDHHRSGNHDLIATSEFTIHKLTEENLKDISLINPKKQKKKGYKDSGTILFKNVQIIKNYTLMDYKSGGCNISLSIAIDFTASNGLPNNPNSLHFLNPSGLNQYEQALFAVSQILLCYDSDRQVPVYGFGGKINGSTSHCFHVNFNPQNPSVNGIENIMNSYRNALKYVELNGPTLFAQFLGKIIGEIESETCNQHQQNYNVVLILTDGEIHDMQDTVNAIVRGSRLPLSIIIVGIGMDSFQNMRKLDADDEPLVDSRGTRMERDIVQFVPFREVNNSPQRLAKEVLAEIPREFTNFFKLRGIVPNPPVMAEEFDYQRSYSIAPVNPGFPGGPGGAQGLPPAVNFASPEQANPAPHHHGSHHHGSHNHGKNNYGSFQPGNNSAPMDIIYNSLPHNPPNQNPGYNYNPPNQNSGYSYNPPPN